MKYWGSPQRHDVADRAAHQREAPNPSQVLDAWLPILGTYNKRIIYIDGFAGPGEYAGESRARPSSPFSGADQFQFAVLLAAGALIAFLGSLGVFTRRIGHS